MLVRLLVMACAPAWLMFGLGLAVIRLLRRQRPLFLLHDRVGYQGAPLVVPKLATASVPGNQRKLFGLVEIATGPPVDIYVEGNFERWLRRSGLDEVPQLALVASGRMRLIGPRPVTASEVAEMYETVELRGLDFLKPGLLGLWQLLDRDAYTLAERAELDAAMIRHWSASLRRRVLLTALGQFVRRLSPNGSAVETPPRWLAEIVAPVITSVRVSPGESDEH